MYKISLIALFFLLTFFPLSAQVKKSIDLPYLETTAKVDSFVTPDEIHLSILLAEKDTKDKRTVEELEHLMEGKLEAIGIEISKQLTLADLASNFRKYFLRKQDVLKSKSFELIVSDAQTAGRVIYELEGIGIANVHVKHATYSGMEELQLALKSRAVEKAKQQAEAMLKPLHQNLGKAIFISDLGTYPKHNILQTSQFKAKLLRQQKSYNPIAVDFEKIQVVTEIRIKFAIN